MMLSAAMPSLTWGSQEAGPTFASEVPHGLQPASYLGPSEQCILESHLGPFDDQIPSIDESVFDLLDAQLSFGTEVVSGFTEDLGLHKWDEIPDLEEVLYMSSPSSTGSSPLRRLSESFTDDEIPPLEDVEQTVTVDFASSPINETISSPVRTSWGYASSGDESPDRPSLVSSPVMFEEAVEEEIVSTSCNTVEILVISPAASVASSEYGSVSPASSFVDEPADFLRIPVQGSIEKRRRLSQVSVASSSGVSSSDERASPAPSTSGYDEIVASPPVKRKGGRKAKFTAADRKERKKEQNRTAAERYRLKRKIQDEVVGDEEQSLIDENVGLKTDVAKLEAEVSCLKRLMRDMLKAKGIEIPPKKKSKV